MVNRQKKIKVRCIVKKMLLKRENNTHTRWRCHFHCYSCYILICSQNFSLIGDSCAHSRGLIRMYLCGASSFPVSEKINADKKSYTLFLQFTSLERTDTPLFYPSSSLILVTIVWWCVMQMSMLDHTHYLWRKG